MSSVIHYFDAEVKGVVCLYIQGWKNPYLIINVYDHDIGTTIEKVSIVTATVHATLKK